MNPLPPSLPPGVSLGLVILMCLGGLCLGLLIGGAIVRTATNWVAGFKPGWGKACGLIICSGLLTVGCQVIFMRVMGVKLGQPHPGLPLWFMPIGFLLQMVLYKAILSGEGNEEISLLQAAVIAILHTALAGLLLVAILVAGIFLIGGFHGDKLQQLRARYGGGATPAPVRLATPVPLPAPPPTFATVAEAQKEAVRRHPMLGVQGSRMNKAFLNRYHLYQQTKPSFFQHTSWPVELADEVANDPAAQ